MHLAEISLARPVQSSLHVKHKFEFIFLFQLVLCPEIRLFNLIESKTRIINSRINHFASSWIDLKLKVKGNQEITTQKQWRIFFLLARIWTSVPWNRSQCAAYYLSWLLTTWKLKNTFCTFVCTKISPLHASGDLNDKLVCYSVGCNSLIVECSAIQITFEYPTLIQTMTWMLD